MLSNKWTFSLKILVVMLALAFVGHTAMAAEFGVTLSVGAGVDASSADNIQVEYPSGEQSTLMVMLALLVMVKLSSTLSLTKW